MSAVVFDMDGVLFLSRNAHAQAYQEVCREWGLPEPEYTSLAGMRTDFAFQELFRQAGRPVSEAEVDVCVKKKRTRARELLSARPPVDREAFEVVSHLSQKWPVGLASSSSARNVELFLKSSGLGSTFKVVLSGDDLLKGKPDPEIYLRACEHLGVRPQDAWAVEDSASGVTSALRAGMKVVGRTGELGESALMALGVHAVIHDLRDLKDWTPS